MEFMTPDGERFSGDTPLAIIQAMAAGAFQPEERDSLPTFMGAMALRVRRLTGASIAADSPEAFLAGLVQHGLLKPAPEPVAAKAEG